MVHSQDKPVIVWLVVCGTMIFAMVLLGGAVRVTGSGLSMVDWKPLMGVFPPLDHEAWLRSFEQYKQFPEYKLINRDMDLGEYKFIFLMEYAHRILGRLIGLVFLVPFVWFLVRGMVGERLVPRLWALFALGALQGGIGWYMVKSGLVDVPHVSQYRLTLHLMIAVLIYAYMVRIITGLTRGDQDWQPVARGLGIATLAVVLVMIASGGFVAGTRAGYIYNTYPTMGGQWIPDQVLAMAPLWRNFFDNPVTVQLVHRTLALLVFATVIAYGIRLAGQRDQRSRILGFGLMAAVTVQVGLGISTLVMAVPPVFAVAHQGGALVVLTLVTVAISARLPASGRGGKAGPG